MPNFFIIPLDILPTPSFKFLERRPSNVLAAVSSLGELIKLSTLTLSKVILASSLDKFLYNAGALFFKPVKDLACAENDS